MERKTGGQPAGGGPGDCGSWVLAKEHGLCPGRYREMLITRLDQTGQHSSEEFLPAAVMSRTRCQECDRAHPPTPPPSQSRAKQGQQGRGRGRWGRQVLSTGRFALLCLTSSSQEVEGSLEAPDAHWPLSLRKTNRDSGVRLLWLPGSASSVFISWLLCSLPRPLTHPVCSGRVLLFRALEEISFSSTHASFSRGHSTSITSR